MYFALVSFPKFVDEFSNSPHITWEQMFQHEKYRSFKYIGRAFPKPFYLDDIEYTHFVIRWS